MTVRISEEFDNPQGAFTNYDAYDVSQRAALAKQRHVDIRSFVQTDLLSEPLTMSDLGVITMTGLDGYTMTGLETGAAPYYSGEHWAITAGTGTLVVGPQSDRNHWNGLALTFSVGANAVTSVVSPAIDILTGFADTDLISLAFAGFPLSSITLGSSFVDFTSHPTGDFTAGPVASVAFNSAALTSSLTSGDTEMRFPRSALTGINLAAITGVRLRVTATATSGTPFRCLAIRLLASNWVYAPIDTNTFYHRLVKPVTRNGAAAATSAFPVSATAPTDWPILLRATTLSSPDDDPRPFDVSLGVPFNTGSMTGTNTIALYLREFPKDVNTQLNLDPSGGTAVRQATLDALGRQPDYDRSSFAARRQSDLNLTTQTALDGVTQDALERIVDPTSLAFLQITLTYGPSGTTITFYDANMVGYADTSLTVTLTANTNYYLVCDLQDETLRFRIFGSDAQTNIDHSSVVYDSGNIYDDSLCERRPGRVGWYAQFTDGDTYISNIRARHLNFGEYRSHAFVSVTPAIGAQLAVDGTPASQLVTYIEPGPYGGLIALDTVRAASGHGYQITNSGTPNQGIQTNPFYVEDWNSIEISFDVLFPDVPNSQIAAYLLGEYGRKVPVDLPTLTLGRWQHVHVLPTRAVDYPTGAYSLVLYQELADVATWYVDELKINDLAVSWRARAALEDALMDYESEWTDFRQLVNGPNYGALFPERGSYLQVSGRRLKQDAEISKVTAAPFYAQPGRFVFTSQPVSTASASFTQAVSGRQVSFDGSLSSSSVPIISWEWSFGDGTYDAGPHAVHTYVSAGTYSVTLKVRDAYDNVATATLSVTVT